MIHYPYNRTVDLIVTFTNPSTLALVNPGTVTFRIKKPDGTLVTETLAGGGVTQVSQGVYRCRKVTDQWGVWTWDAEGIDGGFEAVLDPPREFVVDHPAT